jgi:REP element-mobilizing transposase RayT
VPRLLDSTFDALAASGDASLVISVIMPDHVHLIFTLGERLTLSQVVAKWKVLTGAGLGPAGLKWQVNFFEHRLRREEEVESYAFYVFMNPYVAGLCQDGRAWPWWRKGSGMSFCFESGLLEGGVPPPEWIKHPDAGGESLAIGE